MQTHLKPAQHLDAVISWRDIIIRGVWTSPPVRHLIPEAIGFLLVLGELFLPQFHAAVGFLQGRHQLGVAVLQSEQLSLQVDLAHGPDGESQNKKAQRLAFNWGTSRYCSVVKATPARAWEPETVG